MKKDRGVFYVLAGAITFLVTLALMGCPKGQSSDEEITFTNSDTSEVEVPDTIVTDTVIKPIIERLGE